MNTFSIEELDREEIEFLPPRVVMTACQPKPTWCQPAPSKCAPPPVCEPHPCCCPPARCDEAILKIGITVKIGGGGLLG